MDIQNFRGGGGGLGRQSLTRWRAAGGSDSEFARQAMARHDLSKGWRVQEDISGIIASGNQQAAQQAQNQAKQQYESQLSSYKNQLDDYSKRFTDVTSQYAASQTKASEYESKWKQSEADYEAAKAQADAYKTEAIDSQLSGLRQGSTVQGRQADPYGGISAGRAAVSAAAADKDTALEIEKKVRAEDSVLNNKGPVVEVIGRRSQPSASVAQGLARGGASHYASRFG